MNNYCLTFDLDWAPDFAIENAAEILINNKIKCTWFITHSSPYIEKLFQHKDLFDFGIHPNFLSGSSHGKNEKEVMKHICSIVPGSKIVRTHALYQSSRLYPMMIDDFGIEIDCSLILYKTPGILPHKIYFGHNSKGLLRIPYFWEEDFEMYDPGNDWDIKSPSYHPDGIKIFNFHPIFTYLNSDSMYYYEKLKTIKPLNELKETDVLPFINNDLKKGTKIFFNGLVNYLVENKIQTYKLSEVKNEYENSFKT